MYHFAEEVEEGAQAAALVLLLSLSNHLRLPALVSRCGADTVTSCPVATIELLILFLYASTVNRQNESHISQRAVIMCMC